MAWIESHQALLNHPKTVHLASIMGWHKYETVGRLHAFWWWCVDYAEDGRLDKYNEAILGAAAGLAGDDCGLFVRAMKESRWLDTDPFLRIHDWFTYFGRFLQVKYKGNPDRWKSVKESYESCNNPPNNGCNNPPKNIPENSPEGGSINQSDNGSLNGSDNGSKAQYQPTNQPTQTNPPLLDTSIGVDAIPEGILDAPPVDPTDPTASWFAGRFTSEQRASPRFLACFGRWIAHLKALKKDSPQAIKLHADNCAEWGIDRSCAAIRYSINGVWPGLYEPKPGQNGQKFKAGMAGSGIAVHEDK